MMIDVYEIYMIISDQIEDLQCQYSELNKDTDYIQMLTLIAQELALEKLRASLMLHENHNLKKILKEGD